jgi:hypothetical protein
MGCSQHLPDEPPGHGDLLRPSADDQAVPGFQFGDRALARQGMARRHIRERSGHPSSFATSADTELINDLLMLVFSTESRNIPSIYQ